MGNARHNEPAAITATTDPKCIVPPEMKNVGRLHDYWERVLFVLAREITDGQYNGGMWESRLCSNGARYWRPKGEKNYTVHNQGAQSHTVLSSDAFGITVCLYVCSHGSMDLYEKPGGEWLADNFHALRDYACEQTEGPAILEAID